MATPTQPTRERPLSPHLQIYRWPVTMLTSILHRATGVANAAGLALLTLWLVAASMGPNAYLSAQEALASIFGRLVLFGFTLSLSYHLLNGIRHLFWDVGAGFGLKTARLTGLAVLAGAILLTLIIWASAYMIGTGTPGAP
ncbi:MAG: succinate dehydrogenase, cytochrome b556 subunit [Alphaproteobacteria bacterium]